MNFSRIFNSRNIYFFGLMLLAVSLPLSIYTTSIAEIILILNWMVEGKFREKAIIFKNRKALWIITSLYLLHIVGLLYTSDFSYAFHDLKIKLPILLLPLIIGTSENINPKRLKIILLLFSAAVIASSLISMMIFTGIIQKEIYDIREISIFISHIRLSLMVNLAIFILVYYSFVSKGETRFSIRARLAAIVIISFLILFLFLLKSLTGIIIFIILGVIHLWIISGKLKSPTLNFLFKTSVVAIPLLIFAFVAHSVLRFYDREEVNFSDLEKFTAGGNAYFHDTLRMATENGNYVWLYVNEYELRECWNERSDFEYDGLDKKKQNIKFTLIRYLTSRGFRKDCEGVNSLSEEDVGAIENGIANYIFLDNFSLYPRVYEVIWELDGYRRGRDPGGHSVAQRIAYLKAARYIISGHFLIGTGTGDVQNQFDQYYINHSSSLDTAYRRRAHNQYVTFFITFGIIGFVISMFSIFAPVFYEKKWHDYLFIVFFIIGMLSMLNEDTLETQTGVSFFMFFYALLLFDKRDEKLNSQ